MLIFAGVCGTRRAVSSTSCSSCCLLWRWPPFLPSISTPSPPRRLLYVAPAYCARAFIKFGDGPEGPANFFPSRSHPPPARLPHSNHISGLWKSNWIYNNIVFNGAAVWRRFVSSENISTQTLVLNVKLYCLIDGTFAVDFDLCMSISTFDSKFC